MRNLFKRFMVVLGIACAVVAVASCKNCSPSKTTTGPYIELEDYKDYVKYELESLVAKVTPQLSDATVKDNVNTAKEEGLADIDAASSVLAVMTSFDNAKAAVANCIPIATGLQSYTNESVDEKTKILGILEQYGVDLGLTGISLFENGGYVMYNDRITLGTENYITNYGFGTLPEGSINADLAFETNANWKRYYHTYDSTDPGTANYLNANDSRVGDFYGYFAASYYTNFMNDTKDGYTWTPELAKTQLSAYVDGAWTEPGEYSGQAAKWRFEVRTGKDGLKYNTLSTLRQKYNNRDVALEDYLTPFKLLLDATNGFFRGSEFANSTTGAIKGAKEYYTTVKGGKAADFSTVGVKAYEEAGKEYFEFEYTQPYSAYYARYYISSSLYMPIPQEFLDEVGVENYIGFNADKTQTPVDNVLSLGAYTLERWDSGQQVVYKKNPNYVFASTKYQIEGVHINILTAANTDPEAGFKEFLDGHIDSASIPQSKLAEYSSDPRTRITTGDSVFKLNVNALDQETWEKFFGVNGTVTTTDKDNYWQVEPILSNTYFVKGLSFAIDRFQYASARGFVPSINYFSSAYMSDPEEGVAYNTTTPHKDAIKGLLPSGTDDYGYSLELAREYFRIALTELEAQGIYTPGTKEKPRVIELECAWFIPAYQEQFHNALENYWETAFNDESVSHGNYQLDIKFYAGATAEECYDKMQQGQFDIAFGAISGDPMNPLSFMQMLSSDVVLSAGFTLNWAVDTNDVDSALLVYDGKRWSYDGLYNAANSFAVLDDNSTSSSPFDYDFSYQANADNSGEGVVTVTLALKDITTFTVSDVVIFHNFVKNGAAAYEEETIMEHAQVEVKDGVVTITIDCPADLGAKYADGLGFDIYYTIKVGEYDSTSIFSVYVE